MRDDTEAILTPGLLLQGYASGIFPMADSAQADAIYWVDPRRRGVFPLDGFHLSRSLARRIRRGGFDVAVNQDFEGVVSACADREETWINSEIYHLYAALHRMGHAHSVEVRIGDDLIGGIYGVTLGAAFFGESMFSRATDGSKIALAYLVHRLVLAGFELFDTQFQTDHLKTLGVKEIPRAAYHDRLAKALRREVDFLQPKVPDSADLLQHFGR